MTTPVLLGARLNQVTRATCPQCGWRGPMDVHEAAVRWACGHTRTLPPLPSLKGCAASTIRRRAALNARTP